MGATRASTLDKKRFQELILYVARATESDPKCGSTKLNKLLFYADFRAYRALGKSISGQSYRKREYGPVPARILPVVEKLCQRGACAWAERDYYGLPLKKLIPLREPDVSVFTSQELNVVRTVIDELWELNATEVSDLSHRFPGWQAAEMGEEISYNSVFVGEPRPLTPEEADWAAEAVRTYREAKTAAQGR